MRARTRKEHRLRTREANSRELLKKQRTQRGGSDRGNRGKSSKRVFIGSQEKWTNNEEVKPGLEAEEVAKGFHRAGAPEQVLG